MTKCKDPNCTGEIMDGFCAECGAPEELEAPAPALVQSQSNAGPGSGRSSRLSARPTVLSDFATASSKKIRPPVTAIAASTLSSKRSRLGAGLVDIAPVPRVRLQDRVRMDLVVPKDQRFCANQQCVKAKGPVALTKSHGYCPKCGTEYWYLDPGTSVCSQYEIIGPIARGGFGTIHGAFDSYVGREVVLKTMTAKDAESAEDAIREKAFLAQVRHPNIVTIYNFVSFAQQGFIVMEYIGGQTLEYLLKQRLKAKQGPMPAGEAVSLMQALMPAFADLHKDKILYFDFKPANAMIEEGQIKLIDLGGCASIAGGVNVVFNNTPGYSPPECGSTAEDDVLTLCYAIDTYTVFRTLLSLITTNFDVTKKENWYRVPTPLEEPVFEKYPCLYRLIVKGAALNQGDRFQTADEAEEQLHGVLKQIAAIDSGQWTPSPSSRFHPDLKGDADKANHLLLPARRVQADAAQTAVQTALALHDDNKRLDMLNAAINQTPDSIEAQLAIIDILIESGKLTEAQSFLLSLYNKFPYDWRVAFSLGKLSLAQGDAPTAYKYFDAVCSEMPGETQALLSLALAAEAGGDMATAIALYEQLVKMGSNTAAFGLARLLKSQDRHAAARAFQHLSADSAFAAEALMREATILIDDETSMPSQDDVVRAAEVIANLPVTNKQITRLRADVLSAAIKLVESRAVKEDGSVKVFNVPFTIRTLRDAAEEAMIECKRFATSQMELEAIVDAAKAIANRKWF